MTPPIGSVGAIVPAPKSAPAPERPSPPYAGAPADTTSAPDSGPAAHWVREDPPFGGPAAAVVAGVDAWAEHAFAPEWMFLLASDLPRADAVVARLRADILLLPSDTDGLCLADDSGRPQWLCGLYRTSAVGAAASALPAKGRDAAVRTLFDDLQIAVVRAESGIVDDIDTWDDLARARERVTEEET